MSFTSVVMKGTRLCNLRCSYCHDWSNDPNSTMKFEVLAKTISSILSHPDNKIIEFVWHGGEPTILPISYYEKIVSLQSLFKRKEQTILNRIQTNGTKLDVSWINFIKNNNFIIGLSIDGPPSIHDQQRVFSNGKGSFDQVLNSIQKLQKEKIPFMVLMVIDELGLKLGASNIFNFFIQSNIKHYGLLAATPINNLNNISTEFNHYIDPKRFVKFLIEMYNCWVNHGDYSVRIREIDDIIRLLYKRTDVSCTLKGSCFGNYFIVEADGQIAHCELFQGDQGYTLGNILDMSFENILNSKVLVELKKKNNQALYRMKECKEFDICNGWCPHERYLSERHNPHHDSKCCGLYELINYIRDNPPHNVKL